MTNPSMILSALKERLENIRNEDNEPLLKSVKVLTRPANAGELFEHYPDLNSFLSSANGGLTRTLALELFLIDETYHSDENSYPSLEVHEKVMEALSPDASGRLPEIGGAHIRLFDSTPGDFGSDHLGWSTVTHKFNSFSIRADRVFLLPPETKGNYHGKEQYGKRNQKQQQKALRFTHETNYRDQSLYLGSGIHRKQALELK